MLECWTCIAIKNSTREPGRDRKILSVHSQDDNVAVTVLYVCMYCHACGKSMDQSGKVANPARGQLNRENEYFPVPVRA